MEHNLEEDAWMNSEDATCMTGSGVIVKEEPMDESDTNNTWQKNGEEDSSDDLHVVIGEPVDEDDTNSAWPENGEEGSLDGWIPLSDEDVTTETVSSVETCSAADVKTEEHEKYTVVLRVDEVSEDPDGDYSCRDEQRDSPGSGTGSRCEPATLIGAQEVQQNEIAQDTSVKQKANNLNVAHCHERVSTENFTKVERLHKEQLFSDDCDLEFRKFVNVSICLGCSKSFKRHLTHLTQKHDCAKFYDIASMKASTKDRVKKFRQRQTPQQKEKAREKAKIWMRKHRVAQTPEERENSEEKARKNAKIRMRKHRAAQTSDENEKDKEKAKTKMRKRKAAQTPEVKEKDKEQAKIEMRRRRAAQTPEEREKHKERDRNRKRKLAAAQTPEEKEKVKEKDRQRKRRTYWEKLAQRPRLPDHAS